MKTAFVVLGMHRSGTSAVAGSLAMAGVAAPTSLMPAKPDNPLGFWESERIVEFDDEILKRVGSCWQDWGAIDLKKLDNDYRPNLEHAAAWVIDVEFNKANQIVMKDPRICRFYPFWRKQLRTAGYRPISLSPVRSPAEVAKSLASRNGMPMSLAYRLWLRHVLDAEWFSRGDSRHIVTLDDFARDWRGRFERITAELDIDVDWREVQRADNIDRFWSDRSSALKRTSGQEPPKALHPLVSQAWDVFIDLSRNGETAASLRALDGVRHEFNELSTLFYDPIDSH